MKSQRYSLILYLLILSLVTFGCSKKKSKSNQKNSQKKIAVVVSTMNNPYFVVLANTAAKKARQLGYKATIFNSQNSNSKEADNFDNLIAAGYSAILFNATDSKGSVSNVQKAKKAGIPTFCMDREIDSKTAAESQIFSDNYSGAVKMGQYFVKVMHKKGKYAELLGLVGDDNTWSRSKGFHSVVDNYPNLKMVAQQSADFDRNKAMDVMQSILQAHSDINAIFCGNDAMAMGAYQAIVSAGLQNKIKVFGFDGAKDVINAIKKGEITATMMQFPRVMADKAAEMADEYLKGKRNFQEKIPVSVDLVTEKNVNQYIPFGKKQNEDN
ncbi:MAG TPA: D-ribose ABC transporter substrate-binding protein [Bacteroidales bacterium]|nr:D-ribose ABC transporter substrate-binding protein [Bacteroidales bacterium]